MMPLWVIAIAVAAAGFIGGLACAYYNRNRSLLDEDQATEAGASPTTTSEAVATYLGTGFIGAIAGCVSWAGAYGSADISANGELTFTALTTAFFVGLAGPKWLQSERDKGRWQAVTSQVAVKSPDPELQATLSMASSDQAVQIARAAPRTESGGPRVLRPRSEAGGQGRQGRPGGQGGGPPRGQEPYHQQQQPPHQQPPHQQQQPPHQQSPQQQPPHQQQGPYQQAPYQQAPQQQRPQQQAPQQQGPYQQGPYQQGP